MNFYIVIPAHNEGAFLEGCLLSICQQTLLPKQLIIVNDNSSDNTGEIAATFAAKYPFIQAVEHSSSSLHMPGSKVVRAFNYGLKHLDKHYEVLIKLDADILLPEHYLASISTHFKNNPTLGICGGFAYEQDRNGAWILNHPMDKTHIRGAFKAYSKNCFEAMKGLRIAMGWDTVDELLAQYHGFELKTDPILKVKHLRPIGAAYNKKAKLLQGKAMYGMRYGLLITLIAALKMAIKQQRFKAFFHHMGGFFEAKKENAPFMVNHEEGVFIRRLRWRNIRAKFMG